MAELADKHSFGAEIDNIVSSLGAISCGTKDIFLWDLMRNSAWALYQIRLASVFDVSELDVNPELFIHIVPDKTNNTLSIIDSGIGMTKDDLVHLLGRLSSKDLQETYLRSIEKFRKTAASCVDVPCVNVDNESCLGFCSVFLVADKVMVTTKHNGDEQYVWESQAPRAGGASGGFFTITRDTSGDSRLGRGTKVTLFLKDDQIEYLDERRLKDMVDKYSEIIRYPMSVLVGNKAWGTKKQIVDDEKKKMEQLKKFEGLRKRFEEVLGKNVNKVIVSDRVFELSCWMSLDFIFEINPESPIMEELREKFESKEDDEGVFDMITMCHQAWRVRFLLHDQEYGTSILPKYANTTGPYYRGYGRC